MTFSKTLFWIPHNTEMSISCGLNKTANMKEFLTKCNERYEITGFEYEDGSFNFGVILAKKE